MNQRQDAEPNEPVPTGQLLVPVRSGPLGHTPRFFRSPLGARTAVAFSTEQRLTEVLGADQPWITLAEPALRAGRAAGDHRAHRRPAGGRPGPSPLPTRLPAPSPLPAPLPVPTPLPLARAPRPPRSLGRAA